MTENSKQLDIVACNNWNGAPFSVVQRNLLYETENGVQFGDYSFGPHQAWSIGIKTDARDGFVVAFSAWVHSIGGGVSSYGYDPNDNIVYFGVTLPKPKQQNV